MNEILKILEGYNAEKLLVVTAMLNMEDYTHPRAIARINDIKERIAIIDQKIEDIRKSLTTTI